MSRGRARRGLGVALFALWSATLPAIWSASCTAVLGVGAASDYQEAAKALCQCSASYDFFSAPCTGDSTAIAACAQDACTAYVDQALRRGTTSSIARWLDTFGKASCDSCVSPNQPLCLLTPPVCKELGAACDQSRPECCGLVDKSAVCLAGTCQRCKKDGDPCMSSDECCGYPYDGNTNGYSPPYCSPKGVCTRESPTCKKTGEKCVDASECCGSESDLAACNNGVCYEKCNRKAPVNCPGCCTSTAFSAGGQIYDIPDLCLDKRDAPGSCAKYCDYREQPKGTCAHGEACSQQTCVSTEGGNTFCISTCP